MVRIPMTVNAITLDPDSKSPILVLKEINGERLLPIWIGLQEATAIATEIEKIELSRPMTHDLAIKLINALGARITQVEISELKENTFYAIITLVKKREVYHVDARPSDAVALALRSGADILVNEKVFQQMTPPREQGANIKEEKDQWGKILDELDPNTFKYKM